MRNVAYVISAAFFFIFLSNFIEASPYIQTKLKEFYLQTKAKIEKLQVKDVGHAWIVVHKDNFPVLEGVSNCL